MLGPPFGSGACRGREFCGLVATEGTCVPWAVGRSKLLAGHNMTLSIECERFTALMAATARQKEAR